jgi:hypothetical protein
VGGLGVTNYIVYIFYHSSFEFLMCFSFDAKKYGSYVIFWHMLYNMYILNCCVFRSIISSGYHIGFKISPEVYMCQEV